MERRCGTQRRGGRKNSARPAGAAAALLLVYHCPFRYIFGVSCPGCGMTRALVAAVFSDLETAFGFHPLFPLLVPARCGSACAFAACCTCRESARPRIFWRLPVFLYSSIWSACCAATR